MKKLFLLLATVYLFFSATAQDFMLQSWYWDYPLLTENMRFAEYLSTRVDDMEEAGFTYVWLMPISRGSGGVLSVGYDVKDYYNLGETGWSRFGRRSHLDLLLDSLDKAGIKTVADVIYNHHDGGKPETNPELKSYMLNFDYSDVDNGDNPMPSDRYRLYLPVGGNTGNTAGDYYFKLRSKTQHPRFFNKE